MNVPPKDSNGVRWYPSLGFPGERLNEDKFCCIATWFNWDGGSAQCFSARGHGPGGLFCKQHAAMAERENWKEAEHAD